MNPIHKVVFTWKNYDNGYYDRTHWIFEFFDSLGKSLGKLDNRPGEEEQSLLEDGYKLKEEREVQTMELAKDEVIAGLKMGLDDEKNVVYIQFIVVTTLREDVA